MAASTQRRTDISGWRQLGIRRHNQQLFTNKAALGPVRQIIDDRLIWLGLVFNDLVDFQRPDRVCCSFGAALKFARLVQIPHTDERRKFFLVCANRPVILCWRLWRYLFLFDRNSGLFANETGHLIVQSANNIGQSFHPLSWHLALRQKHLHGILMAKQALSKRAIEPLDNCLISVNFSATTSNVSFVFFHFFCHGAHELAARINLKHIWPSQRTAPVNRLESLGNLVRVFWGQRLSFFVTAGDVDDSQRIFVNFFSSRQLVMR